MCLTEYDEAATMEYLSELAHDKGVKQGIKEGIEKLVLNALRKGHSAETIAEFNDIDLELVLKIEKENM